MGKEEEKKDQVLAKREEGLKEWEQNLGEKEKFLNKTSEFLEGKEKELEEREKALAEKGPSVALTTAEKKPLSKDEQELIDDGCKAYGIDKEYLFASGIDPHTREAILVTWGGAKVRYKKGDKVKKLDQVRVDGIPPESKKARVVMGKKK